MLHIELSDDERRALRETLQADLSDLRMQIVDTDSPSFKETLRARKVALMSILEKVEEPENASAVH